MRWNCDRAFACFLRCVSMGSLVQSGGALVANTQAPRLNCRKKRYQSPADAMLALVRIHGKRDVDNLDKHERTYYWCDKHQAYHLTSWRTEGG